MKRVRPTATTYLDAILKRKRGEIRRRRAHAAWAGPIARAQPSEALAGERAEEALVRPEGADPRVIAEVKFRSPSAGQIRPHPPGEGPRVARAYAKGGAAAISVLADAPFFGGSALEVRRIARSVALPVLFKEFVLDPLQIELARCVGASMVLLLVRALSEGDLGALVLEAQRVGLAPVVEAADAAEVERALATGARIVGVNARDLQTFRVDMDAAARAIERIPRDRIAVFMSGVRSAEDFRRVASTRADALLIGEGLMRSQDPEATLSAMLEGS